GRQLLAHELTHTLQEGASRLRRDADTAPPAAASADLDTAANQIVQAIKDNDVTAAVQPLRGRSVETLVTLRDKVNRTQTDPNLERWLVGRIHHAESVQTAKSVLGVALALGGGGLAGALVSTGVIPLGNKTKAAGATAEEGLRILWRALPLLDRLEIYDEGYREIEQAQLDVIRAASMEERKGALGQPARLNAIYANMNAKEEYDARLLIRPEDPYDAVIHLIDRGQGIFSDARHPILATL